MEDGGPFVASPLRMRHLHKLTRAILGEVRDGKAWARRH
jgi:hypothetical protein